MTSKWWMPEIVDIDLTKYGTPNSKSENLNSDKPTDDWIEYWDYYREVERKQAEFWRPHREQAAKLLEDKNYSEYAKLQSSTGLFTSEQIVAQVQMHRIESGEWDAAKEDFNGED